MLALATGVLDIKRCKGNRLLQPSHFVRCNAKSACVTCFFIFSNGRFAVLKRLLRLVSSRLRVCRLLSLSYAHGGLRLSRPRRQLGNTHPIQRSHQKYPMIHKTGNVLEQCATMARMALSAASPSVRPMRRQLRFVSQTATKTQTQGHILSWDELFAASQLARWSGLCYLREEQLQQCLEEEGLQLLGQGRDKYTSWIVAEGRLDGQPFMEAALTRSSTFSSSSMDSSDSGDGLSRQHGTHERTRVQNRMNGMNPLPLTSIAESATEVAGVGSRSHQQEVHRVQVATAVLQESLRSSAAPLGRQQLPVEAASTQPPAEAGGQVQRFVLLRGVHWAAPETSVLEMSRALATFWPVPFARAMTEGRGGHLVCHSGVADMALELFAQVAPFLRGMPEGMPLVFAGHSLGGSLSTLLWALSLLHGHRPPSLLSCHSFGSPPVLSTQEGGGSRRTLELLGASPASCRSWVLEHDPIPRAMMTADPFVNAMMQNSTVRGLLQAQAWLTGAAASEPASRTGLFEHPGEIYLIKGGCEVVPVAPEEQEATMRMALSEALARPHKVVQHLLDHHHGSYAHDLQMAAVSALRHMARLRQVTRGAGSGMAVQRR